MNINPVKHLILSALLGFGIGNAQAQHDSGTGSTANTHSTMIAMHRQQHDNGTTSRPLRKGTRPFGMQPDGIIFGSNVS